MSRFLVVAVCCVPAVGCFAAGDRGRDTLDVYEAAFRHLLRNSPADAEAYLSVDEQDPPAELLARLRKDWPKLKPRSEEPKEKGHRLHVENLKWEGRDRAVLRAGYWFPTRFAGEGGGGDYHLLRDRGKWVVDKVDNQIMS